MPGMADQHDLAPLIGIALALGMDLRDQRAGGVDDRQVAPRRLDLDRARDAMGAENGDAARRDFGELVHELRALGAQALDHVPVVHDFVADIDRRPIFLECLFDNLDRPLDAGAEASRLGQNDPHTVNPSFSAGSRATPVTL
jgi:hypothetical protein